MKSHSHTGHIEDETVTVLGLSGSQVEFKLSSLNNALRALAVEYDLSRTTLPLCVVYFFPKVSLLPSPN